MQNLTWIEALGYTVVGLIGGYGLGFMTRLDKAIQRREEDRRAQRKNLEKIRLERNGRTQPRRADAGPGASRVHRMNIDRGVIRRDGGIRKR